MAFAAPFFAAIGGGSVTTGVVLTATAAASVATGVASAKAAKAAGKHAEAQSGIDANAEGDAAREREVQRKKDLARAFSSQVAQAGASGIAFAGSAAQIANIDIAEAARDTTIDTATTKQRQQALRAQGRAARFFGDTKSAVTLADSAIGFGQTIAPGVGASFDKKKPVPKKIL